MRRPVQHDVSPAAPRANRGSVVHSPTLSALAVNHQQPALIPCLMANLQSR
jgi:hypothetical protein